MNKASEVAIHIYFKEACGAQVCNFTRKKDFIAGVFW